MDRYPQGKLNDQDEGQLSIAIGVKDGVVVIDFMKPISWIGLDKGSAINLANAILTCASSIKTH